MFDVFGVSQVLSSAVGLVTHLRRSHINRAAVPLTGFDFSTQHHGLRPPAGLYGRSKVRQTRVCECVCCSHVILECESLQN